MSSLASIYLGKDAPPRPRRLTREELFASQRGRMLEAIAATVAEKGFAATTVGDVVARAGVSRRTFYEQFADKEDCFLAAYEAGTAFVLSEIAAAEASDSHWVSALRARLRRYLETVASEDALARALIVEVSAASPAVRARRTEVNEQFASYIAELHGDARAQDARIGPLPDTAFLGLVGAIEEVVIAEILRDRTATLAELEPGLVTLVIAAFLGASAAAEEMECRSPG